MAYSRYQIGQDTEVWIPSKLFVGIRAQGDSDKPPKALVTPEGDNYKARKRKGTVESFARGRFRSDEEGETRVIENGFVTGVRISTFGYGGKFWAVDPRGFRVELTNDAVEHLLQNAQITDGEISQRVRWVRCGRENLLTHRQTDLYAQAMVGQKVKEGDLTVADLELGDFAPFQRGIDGIFLGRWDEIRRETSRDYGRGLGRRGDTTMVYSMEIPGRRRYMIRTRENVESRNEDGAARMLHTTPQPAFVSGSMGSEVETYEDAYEVGVEETDVPWSEAGQRKGRHVFGVTRCEGDSIRMTRDEVSVDEVLELQSRQPETERYDFNYYPVVLYARGSDRVAFLLHKYSASELSFEGEIPENISPGEEIRYTSEDEAGFDVYAEEVRGGNGRFEIMNIRWNPVDGKLAKRPLELRKSR